jgi:hypothetical protein
MKNEWHPIETAPKTGDLILICMPGGQSDHYYPVAWDEPNEQDPDDELHATGPAWQCPWKLDMILTEKQIADCHLRPMWCELSAPPTSLCYMP